MRVACRALEDIPTDMSQRLQEIAGRLPGTAAHADWNPPYSGHLDMRIRRDGSWHYQGGRMTREALVRLFAGILRLEGDTYYLVTPVEKFSIEVEELPFVSQSLEIRDKGPHQQVLLTTNVDEQLVIGSVHALCFHRGNCGELLPAVEVRGGLRALVQRSHFYQLVDWALEQAGPNEKFPGILSCGVHFALHPDQNQT